MIKNVFVFICSLLTVFLLTVSLAQAQQTKRVPQIGYLDNASLSAMAGRIEAFRQGLRELGYVDGRNIVIEYRSAEGKVDRLPGLAAELVRLKVDVIVTGGPAVNRDAKEATDTIPIDNLLPSMFKISLIVTLRSITLRSRRWRRLKASSWLVSAAARLEACSTSDSSSCSGTPGAKLSSASWVLPRIAVSRLLKSCAIPPASVPIDSIF